jgi:hypothetical protein
MLYNHVPMFSKAARQVNFEEFDWTLLKVIINGNPVLVRFRRFPPDFEKLRFPVRLNIFWRMSESSPLGLPIEEEEVRLSEFEDLIVKATESKNHSVLSVVLTGDSQREFVFHTIDVDGFLERISEMPQKSSPYPIRSGNMMKRSRHLRSVRAFFIER